eukprot:TRINITY_DN3762_c0_g1_i4.p1 TRINITY_DN3762_c0_g1~~TRINITY_DN3762_c0_g1_i4.p1  ORF type:complete len:170 (+),score=53.63 TRINITY_DN3762_c0_g1_i4:37-546(+)
MKAYLLDDPSHTLTDKDLEQVGILHWTLDADRYEEEGKLDTITKERGYKNRDVVNISTQTFGDAFEAKLKIFFEEHLHDDEEIRFILDGSGFFDVRSLDDVWLRLHVVKGDLVILPKGIYHRFTVDEHQYIKAMRLFQEEPKWTPINRALPTTDTLPSRHDYTTTFKKQ